RDLVVRAPANKCRPHGLAHVPHSRGCGGPRLDRPRRDAAVAPRTGWRALPCGRRHRPPPVDAAISRTGDRSHPKYPLNMSVHVARPERLLAAGAAVVGLVSVISALTPEIAARSELVQGILPPGVPTAARLLALG